MLIIIITLFLVNLLLWSEIYYKQFFKRFYDVILSGLALIVLSPILFVLIILGAIKMKGNPFFTQERPGKDEKVFRLIKFRSMSCEKDEKGILLPDEKRLTKYGKVLRATSLDELPELINILKGDMSLVGPRPLLVQYLLRYNKMQARRHEVRPGFTGLAQVNGRNAITWEEKFEWDIRYVDHITLLVDLRIILKTIKVVFKREGVNSNSSVTMEEFYGTKESN